MGNAYLGYREMYYRYTYYTLTLIKWDYSSRKVKSCSSLQKILQKCHGSCIPKQRNEENSILTGGKKLKLIDKLFLTTELLLPYHLPLNTPY